MRLFHAKEGGRMSQPLPMRGTVQTTATGDSRPPNHYGTAVVPSTTERRSSQLLRNSGCPNRCRYVAPSKRRRLGTVALPTTSERRPSHPLRNGGRPNRYGRAVVPTAADAWHRPNRCRYIAVAQTPDHATHTNSFNSFSIGAAIDSPIKPKRRSVYTFIAFLTEIRHCPSSIQ